MRTALPPRGILPFALALYAGACATLALVLPAPGTLLAAGVALPLAAAWLAVSV